MLIGGVIPTERDDERQHGSECHAPDDAPEILSLGEHEYAHHKARQDDAHGTLGQCGTAHAEDGKPRQLLLALLPPAIEQIHRSYHESCVDHIHTTVDASTVHLEGSEREDGGDEGGLGVLALGKEGETTDGHQDEGDGGRQARGKLVDVTDEETEEGDAPVEERWLVGDVASVVDRQYPVAMLQHGVGYDCLAWLALRIEVGESEERYQHQDG